MKTRLLLISAIFLQFLFLHSQTYDLLVMEESYTPLENSISLNNGEIWDDDTFTIPIGFEFDFYDKTIDSLFLDTNGSISDTDQSGLISLIIPFINDLVDLGSISGESLSNISYLLEGADGNRILKVEWSNAGFFDDYYYNQGNPSFINFQVWLHEADDIIEYRYGESMIDDDVVFQYYGGGPVVGLLNNLNNLNYDASEYDEFMVLTGDPASPSTILWKGVIDLEYGSQLLDSTPAANTVYRFGGLDVSTAEIKSLSENFSIYPNPVLSELSIASKNNVEKIQSVSIFNNAGQLIKTVTSGFSSMNVTDLVSGVYHININTLEGLAVKRFVKID